MLTVMAHEYTDDVENRRFKSTVLRKTLYKEMKQGLNCSFLFVTVVKTVSQALS